MTKDEDFEKAYEKKWEKKYEEEIGDRIKKKFENWDKCSKGHNHSGGFMGGGFYFLTFIGAAVYYIQQSTSFWMGVLGFFQAMVWPAMLIYKVFTLLKM